ncbi:OmpA family protein [Geminicoccus roseus]|uniref:OmpA family protein n=1 Tax=Geminicoccus roseus TaxID=404900 RepID=UPI000425F9B7|nr:OmpA family protein [Geminicoccus roseus]
MIRTTCVCMALVLAAPAAYAQTSSSGDTSQGTMSSGGAATAEMPGRYQVYFDLGSTELDADAMATIAAAADEFKSTGSATLTVAGHTDTVGGPAVNQPLSERRAQAVSVELVRLGVPASAITPKSYGSNDLLVPTADGVAMRENRRVEIFFEVPSQAAEEPAAATTAATETGMVEEVAQAVRRGRFGLGFYYGANLLDEGDDSGKDTHHVTQLLGLNLTFDYLMTDRLNLSLEQAGFYNFDTDDDGFGGRTVAGVDFVFPTGEGGFASFLPHVGLNIGGIYGSGLDDDFIWGPEIGLNIGPVVAKIAYDMPFDRDMDEGIISTTIGIGIPF